jgi:two-component system response regulator RegA
VCLGYDGPPVTWLGVILVVEDDQLFRERLARAFKDRGYRVVAAANVADALASLQVETPAFAVIDLRLGAESGLDLLFRLRTKCPTTRAVILSGAASPADLDEATNRGAVGCVRKPADVDEILAALLVGGG